MPQQIVMVNNTYVSAEDRAKQVLREVDEAHQSFVVFKQSVKDDILLYKKNILDKVSVKH